MWNTIFLPDWVTISVGFCQPEVLLPAFTPFLLPLIFKLLQPPSSFSTFCYFLTRSQMAPNFLHFHPVCLPSTLVWQSCNAVFWRAELYTRTFKLQSTPPSLHPLKTCACWSFSMITIKSFNLASDAWHVPIPVSLLPYLPLFSLSSQLIIFL